MTDTERKVRAITIWKDAQAKIGAHVATILPHDNSVYQIVDSGSRGSWSQPMMMMGMKGLVSNPKGETIELPIKSSLKEGLLGPGIFYRDPRRPQRNDRYGFKDRAGRVSHAPPG